ncbi:FmdB family zinc ribbon protein [Brackiella oedipodis]|uniref:FmdB family zinc ribbon protein n=1 Tax=Brackiella oedipodis TaxID=124225 RepID=UPI00048B57D1|nr:zinc ribbon domain-containing protein [Brackiella oedipodis]
MPIYVYRCNDCGQRLEKLQKMSDVPLKDCPYCGHPALTKQVTAAGFQLKGSGWYVTDFRGGDSSASHSASSHSSSNPSTAADSSDSTSTPSTHTTQ